MSEQLEPWKKSALEILIEKAILRHAKAPPRKNAPVIAIYLRRSVADPLFQSIGAQLTQCILHAQTLGPEFQEERRVYVDRHRSGVSMAGRDGLAAALDDADQGLFSIFLFWRGCRLARNATLAAQIYERLAKCGVAMHLAGRGEIQEFELILLCYSAQRQRETSLEAFREGIRAAARNGELFAFRESYGYRRTADRKDLKIEIGEADTLRLCLHRLDAGDNTVELARHLYEQGIRKPSGEPFGHSDFFGRGRCLLDRPLLKGVWVFDRMGDDPIILPRPDLRIVPADLFDRVNFRYGRPRGPTKPRTETPFLAGITRCTCGKRMVVKESPRKHFIGCSQAPIGACDRKTNISSSVIARDVLLLFRHEILDPVLGPKLEEMRKAEWNELNAVVQAEYDRCKAHVADIARTLDDEAPPEDEEPDPYLAARLCQLEIEHYKLSEKLISLSMPPFREIDWSQVEADRARILRMLECMPIVGRSDDDVRVIELVRSIVSGIELDLGGDGYSLRVWFGVPRAPKGFDRFDRLARRCWMRRLPKPAWGAMRYPEVVLGHHKRAEADMFVLDDGDWTAIRQMLRREPGLEKATREIAEALIFLGMTGLTRHYLPERYAQYAVRFRRIACVAAWRPLFRALTARRSPIVAGAGPAANFLDKNPQGLRRQHAHPVPPPVGTEDQTAKAA